MTEQLQSNLLPTEVNDISLVRTKSSFNVRESRVVFRYTGTDMAKAHSVLRSPAVRGLAVKLANAEGMGMPGLNDQGNIRAVTPDGEAIPSTAKHTGPFTYEITFKLLSSAVR